jgi:hypothetical protein
VSGAIESAGDVRRFLIYGFYVMLPSDPWPPIPLIFIGILIMICAGSWSLAQSSSAATELDLKQAHLIADMEQAITIDIPANWRVDTKNTRPGFISVYPTDGGKNPPSLLATAYPVTNVLEVHTQADFDRREQKIVEDVGHIIDQRKMLMDGCQASAIIFVTFPPQPNKMVIDIGLVRDGMVYAMSFNGTVKQILHYFPQLIAITASFRNSG